LNSSSAYLAHIPAVVFSASTSLLSLIRSRILFLSYAASSRLNLALVSSSNTGLDSKFAGIFIAADALGAPALGAAVPPAGGLVEVGGAGDLLAVYPAAAVGVADINLIIYSFIACYDMGFWGFGVLDFW
jgi:hypothetical protein